MPTSSLRELSTGFFMDGEYILLAPCLEKMQERLIRVHKTFVSPTSTERRGLRMLRERLRKTHSLSAVWRILLDATTAGGSCATIPPIALPTM